MRAILFDDDSNGRQAKARKSLEVWDEETIYTIIETSFYILLWLLPSLALGSRLAHAASVPESELMASWVSIVDELLTWLPCFSLHCSGV